MFNPGKTLCRYGCMCLLVALVLVGCVYVFYRIYRIPLLSSAEEWGRGRKLMACVTPL